MLKGTLPFLLLLLIAGAAFAETATQEATGLASPAAETGQAQINPEREEATPMAVTAVCVADCCPPTLPTQVTCSGSSCTAVDHSCPSQQGHCWSDVEGLKLCSPCPAPPAECTARCATGDPPPTNCTCEECCINGGASDGFGRTTCTCFYR